METDAGEGARQGWRDILRAFPLRQRFFVLTVLVAEGVLVIVAARAPAPLQWFLAVAMVAMLAALTWFVARSPWIPLRSRASHDEYIEQQLALIRSARRTLNLCTDSMHIPEQIEAPAKRKQALQVNEALAAACSRGVAVRILVVARPGGIAGALRIESLAEGDRLQVRMRRENDAFDVRFLCGDARDCVIGRSPQRSGDQAGVYRPTQTWNAMRSAILGRLLDQEFHRLWTTAVPVEQYLPAAVSEIRSNLVGLEDVADHLQVSVDLVLKHAPRSKRTILVIGRPASGKTSISKKIVELLPGLSVGLTGKHFSDYDYLARQFQLAEKPGSKVKATNDGGFIVADPTLFDEALRALTRSSLDEWPPPGVLILEFARDSYVRALDILEATGLRIDLVFYVNVPFEQCLVRNRSRNRRLSADDHFVSEDEMRRTYRDDDLARLGPRLGNRLVVIDNKGNLEDAVPKLIEVLASTLPAC